MEAPRTSKSSSCNTLEKIEQDSRTSTKKAQPNRYFASTHLLTYPRSLARSAGFSELCWDSVVRCVYTPNFEITRFIAISLCVIHLDPLHLSGRTPLLSNSTHFCNSPTPSSFRLSLGDFLKSKKYLVSVIEVRPLQRIFDR